MSLRERTEISPEVRRVVLERDSIDDCPVCRYCGRPLLHGGAHLHHVVRRSQGGEGTPENLITLCQKCHTLLHNGHSEIQDFCEEYLRWQYGES